MKNFFKAIVLSLTILSSIQTGTALAHGTEKHGKTVPTDTHMKKLHGMMPMFSTCSADIEAALDKGDAAAIEAEADKINSAILDLNKAKPRKNTNQSKKMTVQTNNLGAAMNSTTDLAKKGDFAGAKASFKDVEKSCTACHAIFRN
jgi:cytochrome c556